MGLGDWFKNNVENNISIFKDISLQQQALDPNTLMSINQGDDRRKDIVNSMLNEEVTQRNFINDAINQGIVDSIHNKDVETAIEMQKQKEILHQRNMAEIRNTAESIREQQRAINNQEELIKRRDILEESIRIRNLQMQKELNHAKTRESFNFYKVAELLRQNMTLREALIGAGCIKNAKYRLDYDGRSILFIDDEHIDCCCNNSKQNFALDMINRANRIAVITGFDNVTNYSVGVLYYQPEFGVILIKKDRLANEYPTKLGKMMDSKRMLSYGNRFDKIALSKTFVKIAFITAICINIDNGIETKEDLEALKTNCQINPDILNKYKMICRNLHIRSQ